jgi:phenylpropionate dioxygenase-like ring-hydroxylating dioxygenase large terminal subunit
MTEIADRLPPGVPVGISRAKAPEPALGTNPIRGERYYSPEFARLEWEHMWTKVWLVAGRVDQLAKPGEYITYEIGNESILIARGQDSRIRAFYNVCQHRGNRLVVAERGVAAGGMFQCAYHGWRFTDSGQLNWVYCEDDFPQGSPCGNRNLVEIPCDSWGGFVWINMDEGCESLATFLAPVAEQLDCYEMETMKRTHWVTMNGDFNWKCVQDNFNESYHLPYVHPQILTSMDELHTACQFDLYESGHCRMFMPGGAPGPQYKGKADRVFQRMSNDLTYWELDPEPYRNNLPGLREAFQQRKRELGAAKGYDFSRYSDEQLTDNYHYTMFPNVSFSMKPDGCIFLMARPDPTDPTKCLFDMWYLTKFPTGVTEYFANSMGGEWISIDHQVEHQVGKAGEVSAGPGIDQDVGIWNTQQKGLTSRGYRGEYLPYQERRIRFFHDNIDRYIAAGQRG